MTPLPLSAASYSASMPVLMRGAHAALSPNFGAPAMPAPWQATQPCRRSSCRRTPLPALPRPRLRAAAAVRGGRSGRGSAGAAAGAAAGVAAAAAATGGAVQLAPTLFAMNTTARLTSSSVRSLLPPRGGIALKPLIACSNVSLLALRDDLGPCRLVADLGRARESRLVARLADLAVDLLAGRACPSGRSASASTTVPTGWMRASTRSEFSCHAVLAARDELREQGGDRDRHGERQQDDDDELLRGLDRGRMLFSWCGFGRAAFL